MRDSRVKRNKEIMLKNVGYQYNNYRWQIKERITGIGCRPTFKVLKSVRERENDIRVR